MATVAAGHFVPCHRLSRARYIAQICVTGPMITRPTQPIIVLEELGLRYRLRRVALEFGEHRKPPLYPDILPAKCIPALVDHRRNDLRLTQSGVSQCEASSMHQGPSGDSLRSFHGGVVPTDRPIT